MRAAEERIRVILGGGTLAAGVRRGAQRTAADIELDEALFYESVATLWGWTPDQADGVPYDLLGGMLRVARIRSDVEADEARKARAEAQGGA